ncbi:hypothetical protein QOZ80_5AG0391990 [Eleusine coracana subsp. coracana]|nr:hypothetical protein QOZ80_5AG0391990 [Eleusine coracana subsp. coracana]
MEKIASSAVDGALSIAKSAVVAELALQLGVKGDLELIKDEFELMQTFLVTSNEAHGKDLVARAWARQIRDVAYDVEDYIEDFAIHIGKSSWWWCSPSKVLNRRRIGAEMKKLRTRVDNASKRRTLYGMVPLPPPTESVLPPGQYVSTLSGQEAADAQHGEDLKGPSGVVLGKLLGKRVTSLMVVSICARTPTTLIGETYDELAMTWEFHCRAWVTVYNPFNLTEFIRSLLRQFQANASGEEQQVVEGPTTVDVQENLETMGTQELIKSLGRNLDRKRYLLVLDNISTREEWDSIKLYLRPDLNNASRIIVISERDDVAKYCAGGKRSNSFCLSRNGAVVSAFCNTYWPLPHCVGKPSGME